MARLRPPPMRFLLRPGAGQSDRNLPVHRLARIRGMQVRTVLRLLLRSLAFSLRAPSAGNAPYPPDHFDRRTSAAARPGDGLICRQASPTALVKYPTNQTASNICTIYMHLPARVEPPLQDRENGRFSNPSLTGSRRPPGGRGTAAAPRSSPIAGSPTSKRGVGRNCGRACCVKNIENFFVQSRKIACIFNLSESGAAYPNCAR